MKLSLGYSPCPNDCFIFDALVHGKIDTEGLEFEVQLEDVETLNRMAMRGQLDITKLSYHAYAWAMEHYILLRSGSALGFNCGPLLVSAKPVQDLVTGIQSVAIPGQFTTANFLLSLALPQLRNKREYLFSEIEDAVVRGDVDAGLIIHENRFTYQDKGLVKLLDLGEFWDQLIQAPIPLGGIVMRRQAEPALLLKVNRLIRNSVEYAFAHPDSSMPYVRAHAQAMSESVMKQHISLYVNDFSADLGDTGIAAVELLFEKAKATGQFRIPNLPLAIKM